METCRARRETRLIGMAEIRRFRREFARFVATAAARDERRRGVHAQARSAAPPGRKAAAAPTQEPGMGEEAGGGREAKARERHCLATGAKWLSAHRFSWRHAARAARHA